MKPLRVLRQVPTQRSDDGTPHIKQNHMKRPLRLSGNIGGVYFKINI